MLILSYNSISKLEVVSILTLNNIGMFFFHIDERNCVKKYNPIINLAINHSVAQWWNYNHDNGSETNLTHWPESSSSSSSSFLLARGKIVS